MKTGMKYYCYVSHAKVEQLYQQLTSVTVDQHTVRSSLDSELDIEGGAKGLFGIIKAGLKYGQRAGSSLESTTTVSILQRLQRVTDYIANNERVHDLKAMCMRDELKLDAFCYSYSGEFFVQGLVSRNAGGGLSIPGSALGRVQDTLIISKTALLQPAHSENSFQPPEASRRLVSDICLISSESYRYTLTLACSLKYFSDMGGRLDQKSLEWEVRPHSGNHHFFEGSTSCYLDSLLFINGVRDNTIMGTPLFLVLATNPACHL
jgi:hypothetical protein